MGSLVLLSPFLLLEVSFFLLMMSYCLLLNGEVKNFNPRTPNGDSHMQDTLGLALLPCVTIMVVMYRTRGAERVKVLFRYRFSSITSQKKNNA